jgi:predicted HicB family RNase H-like nuclease
VPKYVDTPYKPGAKRGAKKPGRPPDGERARECTLVVRISEQGKQDVANCARSAGVSVSAWIRIVINEALAAAEVTGEGFGT